MISNVLLSEIIQKSLMPPELSSLPLQGGRLVQANEGCWTQHQPKSSPAQIPSLCCRHGRGIFCGKVFRRER